MRFLDTNVLLYAISTAPKERAKAAKALQLLESDDLATSVQVLQEFYVQATRPTKPRRMTHDAAVSLIEAFLRFPSHQIDVPTMQAALASASRYRISYWDAAIVESARSLGCSAILTEDLTHGQSLHGVKIINPFRS